MKSISFMANLIFMQNGVIRLKFLTIVLLVALSPYMLVNAQTNIPLTIDYSLTAPVPDANMKRGYILRDAIVLKNNNVLADLDSIAALNCEIVNLPRDLNQFNPNYDPQLKNYYNSNRSNTNAQYFGADGQVEEFRKVNGSLVVSVNSNFLAICNRAKTNGLQMLIQASGTPVEGNIDGSVTQMFNLDTTRQFQNSARFYAFPASSDYSAVADAVVSWMSIIRSNTGDSNIIWAGHQEPSHTAGYPNGVQTTSGTLNNVSDYVDIWKPIATQIKNQNLGKIAGIQLNEENSDYSTGINGIASKNVPIDYFSIQNYKGENNKVVIDTAFQYLNSNGLGSKKIVFDRYDFDAGFSSVQSRYNSSAGMTQFLKNELVLLNNADKIYGYCLFTGALHQNMMFETMRFLNTMPVRRRDIAGIGQGINAWCTANGNDFYMALWNTATGSRSVTINLKNFPAAYNTFQMNIRKASDTTFNNYGNVTWTPGTAGVIDNIILEQNTFVLIQLNASGTTQATPTLTYTGSTSGIQGSSISLSATSNSNGAITYSVTNGTGSATVSGNTLNLTGAGTVTLAISVAATTNYVAKSITQTIIINEVMGTTPSQSTNYGLEVYPNPVNASDYVYIKIISGQNNVGYLVLYDMEGSIVQKVAEGISGTNTYTVPVSGLSSGIYILKLQTEQGIVIKKITK